MSALHPLPVPGAVHGLYPERQREPTSLTGRLAAFLNALEIQPGPRAQRRFIAAVRSAMAPLRSLADDALRLEVTMVRRQLGAQGFHDVALARGFACAGEALRRRLGHSPFDTQIIAARLMVDARAVEMQTGEGKTLAIGLAAATAAMAGIPVHCVTANDYLVRRDAQLLHESYALLGLTVATVTAESTPPQRRAAYHCDITYCTAKELVFDYLRDRLAAGGPRQDLRRRAQALGLDGGHTGVQRNSAPLLRGLCMAIVDEADSVLIDDARTPLVIAQTAASSPDETVTQQAVTLAGSLRPDQDFTLDNRQPALTEKGQAVLQAWSRDAGPFWQSTRRAQETLVTALSALHLFERDRHYLVSEGKIQMIDQTTGRLMPDRSWSRGLQQLLERKEGCAATREQQAIAQLTFQRFFPRYLLLTGTSATLSEARRELASVYGLRLARVAPRLPGRRILCPPRVFKNAGARNEYLAHRIAEIHATGQPILIGTGSVQESEALAVGKFLGGTKRQTGSESEALAGLLRAQGLAHRVLNARQDVEEALIVAQAGQACGITIATNMAGRGTDIPLGKEVAALGGLHVICCQLNASHRIDRQLQGRSARQGDPGSVDMIFSLDERVFESWLAPWLVRAICIMNDAKSPLPAWLAHTLIRTCQWLEERRERVARGHMIVHDQAMENNLSLGGAAE